MFENGTTSIIYSHRNIEALVIAVIALCALGVR